MIKRHTALPCCATLESPAFPNGFAVGITFNDDAGALRLQKWGVFGVAKEVRMDTSDFRRTVTQAMLLRLVEFCYGTHFSVIRRNGDGKANEMNKRMELTSILRPLRDSREKQLPDTVDDVRAILDNDQERARLLATLDPSSKTPNWYSNLVYEMDQLVSMTGFYAERLRFDEMVQKRLVVPFEFPRNDDQKEALRSTIS